MRTHSMEVSVVGLQFRTKREFRETLERWGSFAVRIEREPDNGHDPNAIKVLIKGKGKLDGFHLGYVRRGTAEILAPRLDRGTLVFRSGLCTEIKAKEAEATAILRFADVPAKKKSRKLTRA